MTNVIDVLQSKSQLLDMGEINPICNHLHGVRRLRQVQARQFLRSHEFPCQWEVFVWWDANSMKIERFKAATALNGGQREHLKVFER